VTEKQVELIRAAFPEIPDNLVWLKIDIGVDKMPLIQCEFVPKAKEENKQ